MSNRTYCVYILTNLAHTVLYTGVTDCLQRRVAEHKAGKGGVFTSLYKVTQLVYFEMGDDVHAALAREKQIKGGSRKAKEELIDSINPEWCDLYNDIL